jgi:hypothetical protein
MELFIHTRHFKNLALYKEILNRNVTGKVHYNRYSIHELAKKDAITFGFFYLVIALLVNKIFFWGGVLGCFNLAFVQKKWLKKTTRITESL